MSDSQYRGTIRQSYAWWDAKGSDIPQGTYTMINEKFKAWEVVNSCQTSKQAEIAMKYLDLLAETHPDLDVGPLHKELAVLFDWTSK